MGDWVDARRFGFLKLAVLNAGRNEYWETPDGARFILQQGYEGQARRDEAGHIIFMAMPVSAKDAANDR